jgi:hypothetical protein
MRRQEQHGPLGLAGLTPTASAKAANSMEKMSVLTSLASGRVTYQRLAQVLDLPTREQRWRAPCRHVPHIA